MPGRRASHRSWPSGARGTRTQMTEPPEKKGTTSGTRRRSERLYLTLPIRVIATDPKGRDFTEDCISVDVSRRGARIRLKNTLVADDVIHIRNLKNNQEAAFRVTGRVGQSHPDLPYADWGVDCLDPDKVIWGVELRDNPTEDIATSALLQCSGCLIVSSFLLTHGEVGATGASAFITRPCPRCQRETMWNYVTSDRRETRVLDKVVPIVGPVPGRDAERRRQEERRQAERLAVQVPIRIRTAFGGQEVTKTVNLSRTGVRFLSSKDYPVGTILFVAAPYTVGEAPLEVKATVEHIEAVPKVPARLVGVKLYEAKCDAKPGHS